MDSCYGIVNSVQTLGSVDGPGVRFVVFMQGCKMRCQYCHNPETWGSTGGEKYSADDLFDKAWKYSSYWGAELNKGGVTVSGGEPLLQIDFLIEFFKKLKSKGVHTAIDTSGQPFSHKPEFIEKFDELLKYTDLILLDIKEIDNDRHKNLTGCENINILQLARYLSDKNIPVWIRYVLVPGVTDVESDLIKLSEFINSLDNVEKIEVLPYHTYGVNKWEKLNIKYQLTDVSKPTDDEVNKAKEILALKKRLP